MARQWYNHNLRFLQTVLREIDIIGYDAAGVVNYMKESNTNCLVVNAGGVKDFFENPLEMANENIFRDGRDLLGEICHAVHAAGMHVLVRVDFRGVEQWRYELHPDWFAADQDGNPKVVAANPASVRIMRPCYNSYYTQEHAVAYIRYLLQTYEIDGIWQNALGFDSGPCYCKNCRDLFFEESGEEIPRVPAGMGIAEALDLPGFAKYRAWKAKKADEHIERLRAAVKAFGEEKVYCAEIFDMLNSGFSKMTGIDHDNARKSFDFIVSCVFIDSTNKRPYDIISNAGTTIRFSRALDERKQPVIVTGGNGTKQRYIAAPTLETRLWLWEIAAAGGGVWNCYFNGQHPARTLDRRNAYSEKAIFGYLAKNSVRLSDTRPAMDVAVYYSNKSRDRFTSDDERVDQYAVALRGIERVLLESHIQFGFVTDENLSLDRLRGVKALLIPNAALMSEAEIDIIEQYVKNGGGVVASYKTSLFDETGKERRDFGLARLFGLHFTGRVQNTKADSYQLVTGRDHPVLKGLGDTDMLMNAGETLLCRKTDQGRCSVSSYIPTILNQPPEYAWVPDLRTDYPVIFAGEYGKGRVVYFANQTDALCFTNGHEDFTEIYRNAVDYASGEEYLLRAKAPRSVHISAIAGQEDENRLVIAFVNASGSSMRPMKEVVPVHGVKVCVPLRSGRLRGQSMLWGEGLHVSEQDGEALIEIDRLDEFASVELLI